MAKTPFELQPGEEVIDTWTLLYIPPGGGKYNGKCIITNQRILYDAKFDYSVKGVLDELIFFKTGSEGYLSIPKSRIENIETKNSFLDKRVILTLDNGQQHTFSYGALNINRAAEAMAIR
jgi:hypothetical protein